MKQTVASQIRKRWTTLFLIFSLVGIGHAQQNEVRIDRRISYQGQIEGTTSPVTLIFRIYEAGVPIWGPEKHLIPPDGEGRFAAVIGSSEVDADNDGIPDLDELLGEDLELEVAIEGTDGDVTVLAPRQKLFPSFHASSAELAHRVAAAGVASSMIQGEAISTDHVRDSTLRQEDFSKPLSDDAIMPPGTVVAFAGVMAPDGWLLCDGRTVSRTEFSRLFEAIGLAYGIGDGPDTFSLPDYRGYFLRGVDAPISTLR